MDSNIITIDFNNLFKEKYKNKYGIYIKSSWSTIEDVINFLKDELNLKDLDLVNEDGVYLGGFNSLEMLKRCKELKAIYQQSENSIVSKSIDPCIEQHQQNSPTESEPPKRVSRKRKQSQLSNSKIEIKNLEFESENTSSQIIKHIIFDDDGNDIRKRVIFKDMCESLTSKPRFFTGYVLSNKNSSDTEQIDNVKLQSLDGNSPSTDSIVN